MGACQRCFSCSGIQQGKGYMSDSQHLHRAMRTRTMNACRALQTGLADIEAAASMGFPAHHNNHFNVDVEICINRPMPPFPLSFLDWPRWGRCKGGVLLQHCTISSSNQTPHACLHGPMMGQELVFRDWGIIDVLLAVRGNNISHKSWHHSQSIAG